MSYSLTAFFKVVETILEQKKAPSILINHHENQTIIVNKEAKLLMLNELSIKDLLENDFIMHHNTNYYLEKLELPFNGKLFLVVSFSNQNQGILKKVNDLFYAQPKATIMTNPSFEVIAVSDMFTKHFGIDENVLAGKSIRDYLSLDATHKIDQMILFLKNHEIFTVDTHIKNYQDLAVEVEMSIYAYCNQQDEIEGLMFTFVPNAFEKIQQKQASIFNKIVENSHDAVVVTNHESKVQWANKAYIDLNEAEVIKDEHVNFFAREFQSGISYKVMQSQLTYAGKWQSEAWFESKSGKITPVWINIFTLKDQQGNPEFYVATYKNLSQMTDSGSANILSIMGRDPLTSLYNKSHFFDRISTRMELEKGQKHHILFIDLDNFKTINDEYGHVVGDRVIESVAYVYKRIFAGHLLARYGGDEFLVYFGPNITDQTIKDTIESAKKALTEAIVVENKHVLVYASFGLAEAPKDGVTLKELICEADKAMYLDKKKRKDKTVILNEENYEH